MRSVEGFFFLDHLFDSIQDLEILSRSLDGVMHRSGIYLIAGSANQIHYTFGVAIERAIDQTDPESLKLLSLRW